MVKITKVSALRNYRLEVSFDDGVSGVVDLSEIWSAKEFSACGVTHIFSNRFKSVHSASLFWLDKIDLCPDSLYLKVTGKKPEDVFPTLRCELVYA